MVINFLIDILFKNEVNFDFEFNKIDFFVILI